MFASGGWPIFPSIIFFVLLPLSEPVTKAVIMAGTNQREKERCYSILSHFKYSRSLGFTRTRLDLCQPRKWQLVGRPFRISSVPKHNIDMKSVCLMPEIHILSNVIEGFPVNFITAYIVFWSILASHIIWQFRTDGCCKSGKIILSYKIIDLRVDRLCQKL